MLKTRRNSTRVSEFAKRLCISGVDHFRRSRVARHIPTDDDSLASALQALDEASEEGDTEEMERLEGLLSLMYRLRGDAPRIR